MQCACSILSSVAFPSLQYFSTLSHKRHDFRKRVELEFFSTSSKNSQILNFTKARAGGVQFFRADRRIGMTKLILALCNFSNAHVSAVKTDDFQGVKIY